MQLTKSIHENRIQDTTVWRNMHKMLSYAWFSHKKNIAEKTI